MTKRGLWSARPGQIKDIFDLYTDVTLVTMERTVAYFGEHKSILGTDLQQCPGLKNLRHPQFHPACRGIQYLTLDRYKGSMEHQYRNRLVPRTSVCATTFLEIQSIPLTRFAPSRTSSCAAFQVPIVQDAPSLPIQGS
jgi:hypothetical protein